MEVNYIMALTATEKAAIQADASKSGKYVGMSWDEAEKEYRSAQSTPTTTPKPASKSASTSSSLDTDKKGWYVTPEGKHLNPKYYDKYGNKITGGISGGSNNGNSNDRLKEIERLKKQRNQPITQPTAQPLASEASTISQSYDDQKAALIASIKEKIAQGVQGQKNIISQAPQTYNPLRQQASIESARGLTTLKETLANQGNLGAGLGSQEIIQSGAQAQNVQNDINLQQQNIINQANQQIQTLESEGRMSEAQAISDNAMAKLQALIESNRRAEDVSYRDKTFAYQQKRDKIEDEYRQGQLDYQQAQDELDRIDQEEQEEYNRSRDTASDEQYQSEQQRLVQDAALENAIASIGAYSNDYQAEINRRQASNPNDPFIPFLQAARNEKIAQQKANADASAGQTYKNAYNLWLQSGIATAQIAAILGIPVGAKTLDKQKADATRTSSSSSSSNGLSW